MASTTRRLSALAVLLVVPAASGQIASLAFVDRSAGLHLPGMEGGRTEVEFADLNGDGHLDLVSVGDHGSPFVNSSQTGIMVWFGDGLGAWSHFQTGYFGYGGVALADVNNDGLMDAAYGVHHDWSSNDFGDQVLEVALGDGTGRNWTPWDDGLGQQGQSWGMFSTDFADVNDDGLLDVGSVAFGCCDGVHVYLNNGDGTWTRTFGFLGGNSSMEFHFGDFNGDGHADFAASHGSGSVYLGDGTGAFSLSDGNLGGGPWRSGLSIGDVDGDGREEIAWTTSGALHVWKMNSPGQWQSLSSNLSFVDRRVVPPHPDRGHEPRRPRRDRCLPAGPGGRLRAGWRRPVVAAGDDRDARGVRYGRRTADRSGCRSQRLPGHRDGGGGELPLVDGGHEPAAVLRQRLRAPAGIRASGVSARRADVHRRADTVRALARGDPGGRPRRRRADHDDRTLDRRPGRPVDRDRGRRSEQRAVPVVAAGDAALDDQRIPAVHAGDEPAGLGGDPGRVHDRRRRLSVARLPRGLEL
ncbi:MAG: VCBS repeat-containing protein [Phycisphaerales bacterium]|nr:VCBS repeat-containing protein [Phycisphaerales bacterium]